MLEKIKIENFRCLRSVEAPLRPLTVLIGPNDSGKSAFLAAVRFVMGGNPSQPSDHWRYDTRVKVSIAGTTAQGTSVVTSAAGPSNPEGCAPLRPVETFLFPSQGVQMESQGINDETGAPSIGANGDNVATMYDYLLRRDRPRFDEAVAALRTLIPGLEGVEIATPHPSNRRLDLVIEQGLRIPGILASTGVRLLLCFVALAYHPSPPKTILLEEPENGVHPKRLAEVMRLLREITQGKHGKNAAQVILTTHSPYLVDLLDPSKEQVLVFRRLEDGSRTVEAADAGRLQPFLAEFMLGEVWFNQGEEGLVSRMKP